MVPDRPVASLTGQRGWEWNRWQARKRSRESTTQPPKRATTQTKTQATTQATTQTTTQHTTRTPRQSNRHRDCRCRDRAEPSNRSAEPSNRSTEPSNRSTEPSNRSTETLETELDAEKRRLQRVIDHYERLLRKRNRQLANCEQSRSNPGSLSTLVSKIRGYLKK